MRDSMKRQAKPRKAAVPGTIAAAWWHRGYRQFASPHAERGVPNDRRPALRCAITRPTAPISIRSNRLSPSLRPTCAKPRNAPSPPSIY